MEMMEPAVNDLDVEDQDEEEQRDAILKSAQVNDVHSILMQPANGNVHPFLWPQEHLSAAHNIFEAARVVLPPSTRNTSGKFFYDVSSPPPQLVNEMQALTRKRTLHPAGTETVRNELTNLSKFYGLIDNTCFAASVDLQSTAGLKGGVEQGLPPEARGSVKGLMNMSHIFSQSKKKIDSLLQGNTLASMRNNPREAFKLQNEYESALRPLVQWYPAAGLEMLRSREINSNLLNKVGQGTRAKMMNNMTTQIKNVLVTKSAGMSSVSGETQFSLASDPSGVDVEQQELTKEKLKLFHGMQTRSKNHKAAIANRQTQSVLAGNNITMPNDGDYVIRGQRSALAPRIPGSDIQPVAARTRAGKRTIADRGSSISAQIGAAEDEARVVNSVTPEDNASRTSKFMRVNNERHQADSDARSRFAVSATGGSERRRDAKLKESLAGVIKPNASFSVSGVRPANTPGQLSTGRLLDQVEDADLAEQPPRDFRPGNMFDDAHPFNSHDEYRRTRKQLRNNFQDIVELETLIYKLENSGGIAEFFLGGSVGRTLQPGERRAIRQRLAAHGVFLDNDSSLHQQADAIMGKTVAKIKTGELAPQLEQKVDALRAAQQTVVSDFKRVATLFDKNARIASDMVNRQQQYEAAGLDKALDLGVVQQTIARAQNPNAETIDAINVQTIVPKHGFASQVETRAFTKEMDAVNDTLKKYTTDNQIGGMLVQLIQAAKPIENLQVMENLCRESLNKTHDAIKVQKDVSEQGFKTVTGLVNSNQKILETVLLIFDKFAQKSIAPVAPETSGDGGGAGPASGTGGGAALAREEFKTPQDRITYANLQAAAQEAIKEVLPNFRDEYHGQFSQITSMVENLTRKLEKREDRIEGTIQNVRMAAPPNDMDKHEIAQQVADLKLQHVQQMHARDVAELQNGQKELARLISQPATHIVTDNSAGTRIDLQQYKAFQEQNNAFLNQTQQHMGLQLQGVAQSVANIGNSHVQLSSQHQQTQQALIKHEADLEEARRGLQAAKNEQEALRSQLEIIKTNGAEGLASMRDRIMEERERLANIVSRGDPSTNIQQIENEMRRLKDEFAALQRTTSGDTQISASRLETIRQNAATQLQESARNIQEQERKLQAISQQQRATTEQLNKMQQEMSTQQQTLESRLNSTIQSEFANKFNTSLENVSPEMAAKLVEVGLRDPSVTTHLQVQNVSTLQNMINRNSGALFQQLEVQNKDSALNNLLNPDLHQTAKGVMKQELLSLKDNVQQLGAINSSETVQSASRALKFAESKLKRVFKESDPAKQAAFQPEQLTFRKQQISNTFDAAVAAVDNARTRLTLAKMVRNPDDDLLDPKSTADVVDFLQNSAVQNNSTESKHLWNQMIALTRKANYRQQDPVETHDRKDAAIQKAQNVTQVLLKAAQNAQGVEPVIRESGVAFLTDWSKKLVGLSNTISRPGFSSLQTAIRPEKMHEQARSVPQFVAREAAREVSELSSVANPLRQEEMLNTTAKAIEDMSSSLGPEVMDTVMKSPVADAVLTQHAPSVDTQLQVKLDGGVLNVDDTLMEEQRRLLEMAKQTKTDAKLADVLLSEEVTAERDRMKNMIHTPETNMMTGIQPMNSSRVGSKVGVVGKPPDDPNEERKEMGPVYTSEQKQVYQRLANQLAAGQQMEERGYYVEPEFYNSKELNNLQRLPGDDFNFDFFTKLFADKKAEAIEKRSQLAPLPPPDVRENMARDSLGTRGATKGGMKMDSLLGVNGAGQHAFNTGLRELLQLQQPQQQPSQPNVHVGGASGGGGGSGTSAGAGSSAGQQQPIRGRGRGFARFATDPATAMMMQQAEAGGNRVGAPYDARSSTTARSQAAKDQLRERQAKQQEISQPRPGRKINQVKMRAQMQAALVKTIVLLSKKEQGSTKQAQMRKFLSKNPQIRKTAEKILDKDHVEKLMRGKERVGIYRALAPDYPGKQAIAELVQSV